jgi:hypothetical protein
MDDLGHSYIWLSRYPEAFKLLEETLALRRKSSARITRTPCTP